MSLLNRKITNKITSVLFVSEQILQSGGRLFIFIVLLTMHDTYD